MSDKTQKKSFILMRDLLSTVDLMTDEEAGQLFKSIIKHVDGEQVELPRELKFAFIPIQNQLNRDIEKYDNYIKKQRDNGAKGGRPKKTQANPENPSLSTETQANPKNLVTVTVTDTVTKKQKKERFAPPSLQELKTYIKEKDLNVGAETFINHYEANGWMVGRTKMKDWRAAARNWSKRNNDQNKDDRESSEKKWQDSATGIRDKGKEVGLRETDFDSFPIFKGAVEREVRRLDNAR